MTQFMLCHLAIYWLPHDPRLRIWGVMLYNGHYYTYWNLPGQDLRVGVHRHGTDPHSRYYKIFDKRKRQGWIVTDLEQIVERLPSLPDLVMQQVIYQSLAQD